MKAMDEYSPGERDPTKVLEFYHRDSLLANAGGALWEFLPESLQAQYRGIYPTKGPIYQRMMNRIQTSSVHAETPFGRQQTFRTQGITDLDGEIFAATFSWYLDSESIWKELGQPPVTDPERRYFEKVLRWVETQAKDWKPLPGTPPFPSAGGPATNPAAGLEEPGMTRRKFLRKIAVGATVGAATLSVPVALEAGPVAQEVSVSQQAPIAEPLGWVEVDSAVVDPADSLQQTLEIVAQENLADPIRNNFHGVTVHSISQDLDQVAKEMENFPVQEQVDRILVLDGKAFEGNPTLAAEILPNLHLLTLLIDDAHRFSPATLATALRRIEKLLRESHLPAHGPFLLKLKTDELDQTRLRIYA